MMDEGAAMMTERGLAGGRAEPLEHGAVVRRRAHALSIAKGRVGGGRPAWLGVAHVVAMVLLGSGGCVGQPPLLPELPATTGTETAETSATVTTVVGEVGEIGEVGEVGSSVGMTSVGTTPIDPCDDVMCEASEQCIGGECFTCPEPCDGGCAAGERCQCPMGDPCCTGGVCTGPSCHPLLQDCAADEGCYPVEGGWLCAPDASEEMMGVYGDPCEYINACDPGLVCVNASDVPGCGGGVGCCTELCDTSAPMGEVQCSGMDRGQVCTPWYEEGSPPPGYEDVGVCLLGP